MRNKQRSLHKQRVNLFKKMQGKYWRVEFRSTRHMNQLILAAREVGYVPIHDAGSHIEDDYTLTMYPDGERLSYYNHDCGIYKATFTV